MGVDHSAFACFGVKVVLNEGFDPDDLDTALQRARPRLTYLEWGSRNYGGDGGLLVADAKLTHVIEFSESPCMALPESNSSAVPDVGELARHIERSIAGVGRIDGAVGWYLGGHTW